MAQIRKSDRRVRPPAKTPEGREAQLGALAVDLAERQMLDGTASATVIVHYLKLMSSREKIEQERMQMQIELDKVKAEAQKSQMHSEELFSNAIAAFRSYSGDYVEEDDEEL